MSGDDQYRGNQFTSEVAEDLDHLITAVERLGVAMLRQEGARVEHRSRSRSARDGHA
jgi:hypothetical protein